MNYINSSKIGLRGKYQYSWKPIETIAINNFKKKFQKIAILKIYRDFNKQNILNIK